MSAPWLNWCALPRRPTHETLIRLPLAPSTGGDVLRRHSVGDRLHERLHQGSLSHHGRVLSPLIRVSIIPMFGRSTDLRREPHVLGWLTWLCLTASATGQKHALPACRTISLRRLMEELPGLHERPALVRLFHPDDVPHPAARFPRPLTPEQDRPIEQELLRRNDVTSNALLLIRYTGIRIGECVDLSFDCLRVLAPGQSALHVPLGKLNTERVVPIDDSVCHLVHRLRFFRFLSAVPPDGLLLARRRNRSALLRELRTALTQVRTALSIARPLVPHMFRHYAASRTMPRGSERSGSRPSEYEVWLDTIIRHAA